MPVDSPELVAAAVGALLGSGATHFFGRPRIGVTVDRITLSPSRVATSLPVPANRDVMAAVQDSPSPYLDLGETETPPERTYVTYLMLLAQHVEDNIADLANLEGIATQLRGLVATEEFSAVVDTYKRTQDSLWMWADGEARRGRELFSVTSTHDLNDALSGQAAYETPNSVIVRVPGTLQLQFAWDPARSEPMQAVSRRTARRVGLAFINQNKQDLLDFFASIRGAVASEREAARRLAQLVEKELRAYSRLQVELLVTNSGRSGVSLDFRGHASIFLEGYTYVDPATQAPARVEADAQIDLTLMPAAGVDALMTQARHASKSDLRVDQASPILIDAGATVRLLATSNMLLNELGDGEAIRQAFKAAERPIRVIIGQFRQPRIYQQGKGGAGVKRVRSRRMLFRDVTHTR